MAQAKAQKTRLAVDVPPAVKERLERLRVQTEADSMSEVVRRALAVYELLVNEGGRYPSLMFADGESCKVALY